MKGRGRTEDTMDRSKQKSLETIEQMWQSYGDEEKAT